ncbi:hypothetical protein K443DRAFT_361057 [Laccaria amethystina LaAM-08-1]|uniref:Uncharacterized protein n=1 Tax=Laccaria amethystina LaAM-08-1 TaxID=1095629 RepID=A0A0C9Y5B2_9AGAR|nr:hypothetical protein K443DRAFT_361057 [Laccaria amethystina LaAM-08-1]
MSGPLDDMHTMDIYFHPTYIRQSRLHTTPVDTFLLSPGFFSTTRLIFTILISTSEGLHRF